MSAPTKSPTLREWLDEMRRGSLSGVDLRILAVLRKRVEELEHDLNGDVGFIGYRASAKVWQDRAEGAEVKLADAHCLLQSAHAAVDPETWPELSAKLAAALECNLPQCTHVAQAQAENERLWGALSSIVKRWDVADKGLRKEIAAWRHFAWLHHGHGHEGLYGDDGERQCSFTPSADFNRDPHERLIEHATTALGEVDRG